MFSSVGIVLVSNRTFSRENINKVQQFLINQLNLLNLHIEKLVIIDENEYALNAEVDNFFKQYDLVIVVGELKNDVVFKALGNIFGDDLKNNKTLKEPNSIDEDTLKIPSLAKLLTHKNLGYPVIYLQRIFILKEACIEVQFMEVLKSHLEQYVTPPVFKKSIEVILNGNSKKIIDDLNKLVHVDSKKHNSTVTLDVSGNEFENMVKAIDILKQELNDEKFSISNEDEDGLKTVFESDTEHIQNSLKVIDKCISMYGPDNVFLSFNGGKDCTVLLHLVNVVLKLKYKHKNPIFCLYVQSQEPFPEQDLFITQCQTYYNLDIMVVQMSIKDALMHTLKMKPNLKACLMGTRRTDPYSQQLMDFQMTDPDWPQVLRVSPVLDWHYSDIWDYLLFYKIPYCKLYDLGYTSIGNLSNTIKNPHLFYFDDKLNRQVYLPAYKLTKEKEERSGRNAVK